MATPRLDPQRLFEGPGWRNLRVATDLTALVAAPLAALAAAPDDLGDDGRTLLWLLVPMVMALLALWGLYASRTQPKMMDAVGKIIAATSLATIVLIALAAFIEPDSQPAPLLARGWLYGTLFLIGTRLLLTWAQARGRGAGLVANPTLIIGAGVVSSHVEMRLTTQPRLGLRPVGYLDANPPPEEMVPERTAPVLGTPDDLERVVRETGARHVVFGFLAGPDRELLPLMRRCEALGLQVSFVPRFFESVNVHLALEHLGGLPLFGLRPIDPKGWQFAIKHVLDRVMAAVLLLTLSPLLAGLAVATRLSSPGPVLFRQRRIGRDGHGFDMLKYRSMRLAPVTSEMAVGGASNVVALPTDVAPGGVEGDDRRTWVGSLMRSTSLDELPQLINVVRGDMSLVGPRPERPEFVELFGSRIDRYEDRHRVKSGVTGWAQVHGLRGKTSLRDRVEWDNYYIENWSLGLDFKILVMTVAAILQRAE
ncbi:MAG TPA: sugar transferase [Thermoleophilaceae bacterium]|nr:sugar transferase [Thermoleophilaceae bacterium]